MVSIGNVDQVMALVRNQLERMARERKVDKPGNAAKSASSQATGKASAATRQSRLQALGSLADLPEEEFGRVLVGALLSHELGEEVARDSRFQSLVERTTTILQSDPEIAAMLRDLRKGLPG